jgi:hypothetical protein
MADTYGNIYIFLKDIFIIWLLFNTVCDKTDLPALKNIDCHLRKKNHCFDGDHSIKL